MSSSPQEPSSIRQDKPRITADSVHVGGESIPLAAIRQATVERRAPPSRLLPYLLVAASPFAGLAVFLLTSSILGAAFVGLGFVVLAALLFRDDGPHDVQAHMQDGEKKLLYTTRRKRQADRLIAELGRSAALTDLATDRARGATPDE
jgi:predicted lysophospholipase L1 biosynthesis ABC-type transport system permease subunit